ncbi:Fur family transcriptional regulator [Paralimibaculum aggregatum]|uniref:Ferric uptake regulation protein n=1 Tax=Paralimibaculum aggregatum TaxID=3036245 RepID=A0ABQ6LIK5_9RHOB|nr:Fur family transcriptional regulator [Limibaculum sp. NKW23]GMG81013.1 Fur family transcriptional regulator [Limibaculum sp. NKW23]
MAYANKLKDDLDDALREAGLRVTRQRAAIVKVLTEAEDHPDAHEVHRRASEIDNTVSLATVYRTLAVLSDKGIVHRHAFEGAPARFETADAPHHDHIIDVDTGAVVEFASAEIERLQREIARQHGFEVVSHRLELYCRRRKDKR